MARSRGVCGKSDIGFEHLKGSSRDLKCIMYPIAHITMQSSKNQINSYSDTRRSLVRAAFSKVSTFQASALELADRLGYRPFVPCHATTASSLPSDAAYGCSWNPLPCWPSCMNRKVTSSS